jgi:hypothetical protein
MPAKPNPRRTSAKIPAAKATAATPKAQEAGEPPPLLPSLADPAVLADPLRRAQAAVYYCGELRRYEEQATYWRTAGDALREYMAGRTSDEVAADERSNPPKDRTRTRDSLNYMLRCYAAECARYWQMLRELRAALVMTGPYRPWRYLAESSGVPHDIAAREPTAEEYRRAAAQGLPLEALEARRFDWRAFRAELDEAERHSLREINRILRRAERQRLRAGEATVDAAGGDAVAGNERWPKETAAGAGPTKDAELATLDKNTPALDTGNGRWAKNTEAAKLCGVEAATLATYRKAGITSADRMLGRDKGGRVWRRQGTSHSHPWYLRSTLKTS